MNQSVTGQNGPRAQRRLFSGTVVSLSGQKTVSVVVESTKFHPKYRKQYATRRRYAVHDQEASARVGNVVEFEECRPLSRTKRWRLVSILNNKTA